VALGRHFPEISDVRILAGVDMVLAYRLEGVGGESHVHRVAGLVLEINGQAPKDPVYGGGLDLPKTPTAVETKTALHKQDKRFDLLAVQLSRGDKFFKFFFHCNFLQSIYLRHY
jgi:hypothetical protein